MRIGDVTTSRPSVTTQAEAAVARVALEVATAAAVEAGDIIRHGLGSAFAIRAKGDDGDVVTELDERAERAIIGHIRHAFPDHQIMAEESGLSIGTDRSWCWVIDPLDGTNNVAIGLPVCSVGIALCHNGIPIVGVVHEPLAKHTWSAVRGQGAGGPDGRLWPRSERFPAVPTLAWLQGYAVARTDPAARALRLTLEAGSRRLIQLWSPLLCWVMLSRGDIDGFVGYRAGMIDLPAGTLIARESGVDICDFDGAALDDRLEPARDAVDFVAGHGEAVSELLLLVKSAVTVTVGGLPD